ncbi:MAG: hypothetical protein R3F56_04810 [Planctomycetota bacterium]
MTAGRLGLPASCDLAPFAARDVALALAFTAASLSLYVAFGQGVLYGDAAEFMVLLHDGAVGHKNHLAYLPLLRLCAALGGPFGLSPFECARACSQAGAALGVGLHYLASRRFGLRCAEASWVTGLVATTPSLVFFATVVEVHAPYFAFLGLAWLAAAHLARQPSTRSGALLGAACGLAYFGHASGLVLPGPLLLVALLGGAPRAPRLRAVLACLAVHGCAVTLVPWLLSHGGHAASPAGAARFMLWWKMDVWRKPETIPLVLWNEWLLAYMPVSLLWLRAFATLRAAAWAALAVLLPYLALSALLLAVYREFGAYQHAVLWLFAWLTVRTWHVPVRVGALAVALAVGIWKVEANDDRARVDSYARGLATVADTAPPLLLVADFDDFEHVFIARPDAAFENLASPRYADGAGSDATLARLDQLIADHRARGGRVFLTAGAIGFVTSSAQADPGSGFAALLGHLTTHYRRQFAGAETFRSYELVTPP